MSEVVEKTKTRNKLGLTDTNIHLEKYFGRILEDIHGYKLKNVNKDNPNVKGIDLKLEGGSLGWQITSVKTTQKVRDTLSSVSENDDIDRLKILVIGEKQSSYSVSGGEYENISFSKGKDIVDTDGLSKKLLDLELDTLREISKYVDKETERLKIQLEVPDETGEYPTNINDYVEPVPELKIDSVESYCRHLSENTPIEIDTCLESRMDSIKELSEKLSQLPRITREFYCFLIERVNVDSGGSKRLQFNYNRLKRICSFPNMEEEISLLCDYGFIREPGPKRPNEAQTITIMEQGESDYLILEIKQFVEDKGIDLREVIVRLNFSEFD